MDQSFTVVAKPSDPETISRSLENNGFGTVFTDHMVTIHWNRNDGTWQDARVEPRRPFSLDPASAVLHYAQEIFEGMKAYRKDDGEVLLFRPEMNAKRFNASAVRMCMPTIPEATFVAAVKKLVDLDRAWVPSGGGSLYLRPFMFASEPFLGVRASNEFVFCVIASPVGSYFKGTDTMTVWVSDDYTRAALGGTGNAKCGGNYAASLLAQREAAEKGCQQVVYLDAIEHRWVEELGGMNIFFVREDGALVTPPLTGTILPGITRDSIIQLSRDRGIRVEERPYSIDEWLSDAQSGRLREVFACGTAAAVAPIGMIRHRRGESLIGDGAEGIVTREIRER